MKHIKPGLFLVVLLVGCVFDQYHSDVADNQYNQTQVHADPAAVYVGEWTAASNVGLRSIKIKEDGRIKVCMSPSSGTAEGKVYLDNGEPGIILKTGAKARIISMDENSLLLDIYEKQEKYYSGRIPDECASAFINFK